MKLGGKISPLVGYIGEKLNHYIVQNSKKPIIQNREKSLLLVSKRGIIFYIPGERIRIISARKATIRECKQYESGI